MSVTRLAMRQRVARELGWWVTDTTTSAGGASGINLISTALLNRGDDYYGGAGAGTDDWWAVLPYGPTSGSDSANYEARQIDDFTQSTGTVKVSGYRNFSAQVATSRTFELHRVNPDWIHDALNRAGEDLLAYGLWLPYLDYGLVVDGLAANPTFQTYSASAFTSWSNIGTPTIAEETTRVAIGDRAASIVASGATEGLSQNIFSRVNLHEVATKTLHVIGAVWCGTASSARLAVTFNGSTYTYSDAYHGGGNEWEGPSTMKIDVSIPTTATQMSLRVEVADGVTAYCNLLDAYIGRTYRLTLPSALVDWPQHVYEQAHNNDWKDYIPISGYPSSGHVLEVKGKKAFSVSDDDADTYEVSDRYARLWTLKAAAILAERIASNVTGQESDHWRQVAAAKDTLAERLLRSPSMGMVDYSESHRFWKVVPSGETKYLVFGG